jgi:membrane-associated phospholipid phosphatase
LTSQAYAQALNEVKGLGQNSSTTRTAYQTKSAMLWAGSPWNTWNEMAEDSASAHHMNLESTARLFALLNLSFADSAIALYDTKYYYQLWRPIAAIREANTVGNPLAVGDPAWTPLITTPPDPSYPAAHSTISAAGAVVLSSFFGDHDQVRVTYKGTTLSFASYTDAAMDTGLSRIYGGAHTRIDHEAGVTLGQNVAQFVLDHSVSAYFGRG